MLHQWQKCHNFSRNWETFASQNLHFIIQIYIILKQNCYILKFTELKILKVWRLFFRSTYTKILQSTLIIRRGVKIFQNKKLSQRNFSYWSFEIFSLKLIFKKITDSYRFEKIKICSWVSEISAMAFFLVEIIKGAKFLGRFRGRPTLWRRYF